MFSVDLDAEVEEGEDDVNSHPKATEPDLADVPIVVATVIDTARWRLLRVAKVMHLASSAARE